MVDQEGNVNIVYIGQKPLMTYVLALISSKDKKAKILARGRNMAKAIDVLEVMKRKFSKNLKSEFSTNTVYLDNKNISELEIDLEWE